MRTTIFFKLILVFTLALLLQSCSSKTTKEWMNEEAPDSFKARFETTKGSFEIEAEKSWSPQAVNRLYQLIQSGFYEDMGIFRVVPNFVVQFGIGNDSVLNSIWENNPVIDEVVQKENTRGTIAFARDGVDSRSIQIFINLSSNSPKLDTIFYNGVTGFPGIAQVTKGMDVVDSFYGGYGDELGFKQDSIYARGNAFLKSNYPKIDFIKRAYIID